VIPKEAASGIFPHSQVITRSSKGTSLIMEMHDDAGLQQDFKKEGSNSLRKRTTSSPSPLPVDSSSFF